MIIGIGIGTPFKIKSGISWSSYWATRFPSALVLTILSDTSIKLDWTNTGMADYDGHSIEISTDGITYVAVHTVVAGTNTFTDTGLIAGTVYYYQIRAYKGTQYSDYCDVVSTVTYPTVLYDDNTVALYDSRDLSTITYDESNKVSRWNDKLESGRDLLQGTSSKQPILTNNGIATDGIDDFMQAIFSFAQPEYLYIVMSERVHINNKIAVDGKNDTSGCLYITTTTAAYCSIQGRGGSSYSISTFAPTAEHFIVRLFLNGAASKLQVDANTAVTGSWGTSAMGGLTIGSYGSGTGLFTNCCFKEIICRKSADDEATETAIYNYLNAKYPHILVGKFIVYASNPIISPEIGKTQSTWASVLKVGSTYHMYYHHNDGIFHATSLDGKTWSKDVANNPVLAKSVPTAWDDDVVGVPNVWKEGITWYMLYLGGHVAASGTRAIGLATSSDGITWTKYASNPVLSGTIATWDALECEPYGIIKVGAAYYLWYGIISPTRTYGLATSTDLITWTKDVHNPIWKCDRFCPGIFKKGGYYYAVIPKYTVQPDKSLFEIYKDTSPTFYETERIFLGVAKKSETSGWDSTDMDTPFILTDDINRDTFNASGGEIWMYYGGQEVTTWCEGLLISTDFDI